MIRIRTLRKDKGLTMKQFGERIGMAESTISLYESGKRQPDNETLKKIADFFDVSTDYLLERTDDKNQKPGETNIKFDEFSYAMYNESKELSEDDKQRLLTFARMLKDSISEDEKTNGSK